MPLQPIINGRDESRLQLILKIVVVVICRLVLNTARRFTYPFAPVLSRELGVPLTSITSLIAVNWATSLLGIFFGPLADRFGYRKMMVLGLVMLAVGMFAGGLFPFYGVILITLFLAGLGKIVFDPAVQAYVSERVPYKRRATAIGFLEISWAGSTLLGIPLIALLIDNVGWRSPVFCHGGHRTCRNNCADRTDSTGRKVNFKSPPDAVCQKGVAYYSARRSLTGRAGLCLFFQCRHR